MPETTQGLAYIWLIASLLVAARMLEKDIFKQLWIGKHNTALYSFQAQRVTTGGERPSQEREQANGATRLMVETALANF
jgi:hypothetical protein